MKRYKLTLRFPETTKLMMDAMQERFGLDSPGALITRALAVYDAVGEAFHGDKTLWLENATGWQQEVVIGGENGQESR